MSSGYNDPSKLADALELARMFKSGGSGPKTKKSGNGGGKGSGNGGGNDLAPMRRQGKQLPVFQMFPEKGRKANEATEPFQYNQPPPLVNVSNIPPPSQRNYTDTLASDPLKRAPGRILGSSPMDFLNRREPSSKPATSCLSQETPNQAASQLVTPVMAAGGDKSFSSANNNTSNASEKKGYLPVSGDGTKASKVVGVEQVKSTTEAPTSSTQAQASISSELISLKPPSKNSISNTFFSLMSEDSDGDSESEPQTPQAGPVSTLNQSALNDQGGTNISDQAEEDLIDISSDPKPDALSQKHVPKPPLMPVSLRDEAMNGAGLNNFGPSSKEQPQSSVEKIMAANHAQTQSSVSQIHSGGKLETEEPKPGPSLRPQAPGFVPGSCVTSIVSTEASTESTNHISPATQIDVPLAVESPKWVPYHQGHVQPAVTESLSHRAPLTGHIITVTPVQIADGRFLSGPSNSQLFVQPQVDTFNQPHASAMQPPTAGIEMRAQNGEKTAAASAQKPKKVSEKPVKGLRSSMWAA